jgi:hypothetical protein
MKTLLVCPRDLSSHRQIVESAKDGTGKFSVIDASKGFYRYAKTLAVEIPIIITHADTFEITLRKNNRVFAL